MVQVVVMFGEEDVMNGAGAKRVRRRAPKENGKHLISNHLPQNGGAGPPTKNHTCAKNSNLFIVTSRHDGRGKKNKLDVKTGRYGSGRKTVKKTR